MELNSKCLDILLYLKQQKDFISIKELAERYNLSGRAIRYNINKIELFLVSSGYKYLDKAFQKGVKLPEDKELYTFIDSFADKYTPYQYVYSKQERFSFIAVHLLLKAEPESIRFFEKKLCISKNSVLKALDQLEEASTERGLVLNRKTNVGIYLRGSERVRRRMLSKILFDNLTSLDILRYMNKKMVKSKIITLLFESLFADIALEKLDQLIGFAEQELRKEFCDESYCRLIIFFTIMIHRIHQKQWIQTVPSDTKTLESTPEYRVAQKIGCDFGKQYDCVVTQTEVYYITIHLLSIKAIKNNGQLDVDKKLIQELTTVAGKMVDQIETIYGIDFAEDKQEVIRKLLAHLRPVVYRVNYDMCTRNPIYKDILMNYRQLFVNTKKVCKVFEEYLGKPIDDHEVSYIALLLGAALLRKNKGGKTRAKIILVCGTGIATASMIASRISELFDVDIIGITSSRSIDTVDLQQADYIISTIDLPGAKPDTYIKVNPILMKDDYEKVAAILHPKLHHTSESGFKTNMVHRLLGIVEKYCVINDKNQLEYELMHQLMNREQLVLERENEKVLNDLLTRDTIKLNVVCRDWMDAIARGTEPLEKKGYVDKDYKDKIYKNFEELGTYMVVAPGIMLSHARPGDGVNQLAMSLITLEPPINFGSKQNDPVRLVVTLAAKDNNNHLNALSQLMNLFMNGDDLKRVMEASDKEEVIEILGQYSQENS